MKLIVGAPFQGKRAFLETLLDSDRARIEDGNRCDLSDLETAQAVERFQLLVRRMVEEQIPVTETIDRILYQNPNLIVVMDTVICTGEESARELCWQRAAGQAGIYLASLAEQVYHVVCGIPTKIRG